MYNNAMRCLNCDKEINLKNKYCSNLCPNCHSLTATYKGANLNKGRKARSKYRIGGNS